jgi:putative ABC transport system substrate-binding protein
MRLSGRSAIGVAALAWAAAIAPATAWAEPANRLPKVGIIAERAAPDPMLAAFLEGLRDFGYVDGQNIIVEKRYGQGAVDKYPALVAELIALNVDVLVVGGTVAARSARTASKTVPIVFTAVNDPVAAGMVTSLARPDGNATGLSSIGADLSGKQLDLLKQAVPRAQRVAVLHNPLNSEPALRAVREAALPLRLDLRLLEVRQASDLDAAFSAAVAHRADAVLALSDPVIGNALPKLANLTLNHRLPAIYSRSEFAQEGGLLAYGPDFSVNYRRAAAYVHKILRGAKPGELPVEQPTKFELVVNAKTAKRLGIALSPMMLQRADRVIQ